MFSYAKLMLIGMSGLAIVALMQNNVLNSRKAQIETLNTKLTVLAKTNASLADTVETLKNMREIEQKILVKVNTNLQQINDKVTLQSETLDEMEKTNAQISDYLNIALPTDIKRMLNGETDQRDAR